MRYCLCRPCGKVSAGDTCQFCAKGFGRVCECGRRSPAGAVACRCGGRQFLPAADYVDLTWPSRVIGWIVAITVVAFAVRHLAEIGGAVSGASAAVFGVTPMAACLRVLDRVLFWTLLVFVASLALPAPWGERVRSGWLRLLWVAAVAALKVTGYLCRAVYRAVEGRDFGGRSE